MRIIEPSVEIYNEPDHFKKIETIARVCTERKTKSEASPTLSKTFGKIAMKRRSNM